MWTDKCFSIDSDLAAEMQAEANRSPVYSYKFGFDSNHNFIKFLLGKDDYKGKILIYILYII